MSIEKINQAIQKVKQMQFKAVGAEEGASSVDQAKIIFDVSRQLVAEVNQDEMLSPQGKAQKEREIKKKSAIELAKVVQEFNKVKTKELEKAEQLAKEIIAKPNDKPADVDIELFKREYNDIKTELAVFGGAPSARKMLDFMQSVEHPYFAQLIRDDFGEFGSKITAHVDPMRVRTVYESLKKVSDMSERTIAETKLAEIQQLKSAPAVDVMTISIGLRSALGDEYRQAVTDPDAFLAGL